MSISKSLSGLKRLTVTELDDLTSYNYFNKEILPNFTGGAQLRLEVQPDTIKQYTANFRCCCKYGLTVFIESYLDAAITPYIHKKLFCDTQFPEVIVDIIEEYTKPIFSLMDLMITTNYYGENALLLAAKYGQSKSIEIFLKYCKTYIKSFVFQGWINSSISTSNALQFCFISYNYNTLKEIRNKILPTMMALLKNGALVCLTRNHREPKNSYDLAKSAGFEFEATVLMSYLSVEKGNYVSPIEYAKSVNDNKLLKFLQKELNQQ